MSMKKVLIYAAVLVFTSGAYAELRHHWRLDESSGLTAYNSVSWIDGQLQDNYGSTPGGGIWQPTLGIGGSLEIPNVDERVRIAGVHMTPSWTVMGWIKPGTQPTGKWCRLVCSSHMDGFWVGLNTTGSWALLMNLRSGGISLIGPAYVQNQWQHVAAVYDSSFSLARLYVNGVAYGPVTVAQLIDPDLTIYIGSDYYAVTDPSITGLYDDFAIYDAALDGPTIYAIYQDGLAGKSINYWQATDPAPADNSTEQSLNVSLSWTTGSNPPSPIANHILFYGTDPEDVYNSAEGSPVGDTTVISLPVGTTSYSPPGLARDMYVYWRVDEKINASTRARGAIWTFSTLSSLTITQQPQNQRAYAGVGASVTFSVEATSETPIQYEWYKDDVAIPQSNSNQLTITDIEEEDAGEYYVVLTNDVGSKTSDTALLFIKGLLGYWPLDGDPNDVSGHGNDGTRYNDPNFVTGISGQAIRFIADNQQRIEIPNESHFDVYDEFTVSFWLQGQNAGQVAWATMIGKGGNNGGWNINKYNDLAFAAAHMDPNPDLGNQDTPTWTTWGHSILDNEWHLVTFVFDGTTESIYIDGTGMQSGAAAEAAANDTPLVIGATRSGSTGQTVVAYFSGLIDDVRIYNYALSPSEIGQLYYDITGTPVCVDRPNGDTDNDCDVDLEDFAGFAADWMTCGLIPDSQCP